MTFLALIQGGIGPDVWDKEKDISAADFEDAANQAKALAEELGGQVVSLEQNDYPQLQGDWKATEPPKDGTDIIAIGRVIWSDEFSTTCEPFLLEIRWYKDDSGYEGWHHRDGLSVARIMGDEVKVDYWSHFPRRVS